MGWRFDRAYYRLVYPLAFRPTFRVGDRIFEVVDLSEEGARLMITDDTGPAMGDELAGIIQLPTGDVIEVVGTVVRIEPPHTSLHLRRGVPFGIMLEQQRFLERRVASWG